MKFVLSFHRFWKKKGEKDEDLMYSSDKKELQRTVKELNREQKRPGFFRVREEDDKQ